MQEHDPLIKEVPGHLLQFEEKIFGMTLTQLLTDMGAVFAILALTASVPFVTRMIIGVLLMIGVLILVHGKVGGYTLESNDLPEFKPFQFVQNVKIRTGRG